MTVALMGSFANAQTWVDGYTKKTAPTLAGIIGLTEMATKTTIGQLVVITIPIQGKRVTNKT